MINQEKIPVAFEIGPKRRVFAQALEWIGWCRAGKDEATALEQLLAVGSRYAAVAAQAGFPFVDPHSVKAFEVVERMRGTATTDFGALAVLLTSDQQPFEEGETERLCRLVTASWATFDEALHRIAGDLHEGKPERGRSPSAMRFHLLETELLHLSAFGPTFRQPDPAQVAEQEATVREHLLAQLAAIPPNKVLAPHRRYGFVWTPRFAVRRSAWHALDHAWELQDRYRK
jgi:hypothetical protein